MKNILLINFGGIGDEILFLPTIECLKNEFEDKGGSKITLVLEPRSASIQQLTMVIDDVIFCDIKARGLKKYFNILKMLWSVWCKNSLQKFDFLITSGSSPLVAILAFLTGIKIRYGFKSKTSFLFTAATDLNKEQYASNMYHDLISPVFKGECHLPRIVAPSKFTHPFKNEGGEDNDFIAIHPGVSKMSVQKNIIKCPSVEFWQNLITKLLERGERVALLGGPDDAEIITTITANGEIAQNPNFVNLYGKTKNLMDMADVINFSRAFICVDSAPMHIGVALNKNIVAIFGPTDENKLIPKVNNNFKVVHGNCDIRPCLWEKRQTTCKSLDCLKIGVEEVLELV